MENVRFGGSLSVPYYTQEPQAEEISPVVGEPSVEPVVEPAIGPVEPEPEAEKPFSIDDDREEAKDPLPNALYELDGEFVASDDHSDDVADEHRPNKKKRR